MNCRHCGHDLPPDCPATVTSCKGYCDWLAQKRGDMLTADEADVLTLFAGLCALSVAIRDGVEIIPELD
jgi:hypothetical protein